MDYYSTYLLKVNTCQSSKQKKIVHGWGNHSGIWFRKHSIIRYSHSTGYKRIISSCERIHSLERFPKRLNLFALFLVCLFWVINPMCFHYYSCKFYWYSVNFNDHGRFIRFNRNMNLSRLSLSHSESLPSVWTFTLKFHVVCQNFTQYSNFRSRNYREIPESIVFTFLLLSRNWVHTFK